MFAIRWLTYLAGTGLTPAGIIDLARPHTLLITNELTARIVDVGAGLCVSFFVVVIF